MVGLAKLRKKRPEHSRPFKVYGGVLVLYLGALAGLLLLLLAAFESYTANKAGGIPNEWAVLIAWAVLGTVFWALSAQMRARIGDEERRRWILGAED